MSAVNGYAIYHLRDYHKKAYRGQIHGVHMEDLGKCDGIAPVKA
jgi:hypothetical protein